MEIDDTGDRILGYGKLNDKLSCFQLGIGMQTELVFLDFTFSLREVAYVDS